ncbi:glycosyltransferase [Rhodobacter sp. ETT8]|uniref:Glycosyltransferase n=1 Tax=Pseudotabrizicola algicola TaxID=2709381 RepID=A0A6B3RS26_9RHOB|nr:glycosyltransferase [Pseudotabrizicola algicola]
MDALLEWNISADESPGDWEVLARACLRQGDAETAALACTILMKAEHLHGDLAITHANRLVKQGMAGAAIRLLTAQFGDRPTNNAAKQALVRAWIEENPRVALDLFDAADDEPDLALLRVDTLRALDRLDEASSLIERLANRFPEDLRVLTRQARIEERTRNWAKAIGHWTRIMQDHPGQSTLARMKVMQLQARFELFEDAASSAAGLMWPKTADESVDLLTRIEVLQTALQSRAVRDLIIAAAAPAERGRHTPETWAQIMTMLLDSGHIGLAAWLTTQGLVFNAAAIELMQQARPLLGLSDLDLRNPAKAARITSPHVLLPALSDMARTQDNKAAADGKILLVNATLAAGGAERQFVLLVKSLLGAGLDPDRLIVALFSSADELGHGHFRVALEDLGVTIVNLQSQNASAPDLPPDYRRLLALMPRRLRADLLPLLGLCLKERPSVIHGWQDRSSIAAGLAGIMAGTPRIILTARNMQPNRRLLADGESYRGIYRMLCKAASVQMAANSEAGVRDYQAWLDLPEGTLSVLHNAIDTKAFPLLRTEPAGRGERPVRIVGVFRLAANKRPELWMRTVARLRARGRIKVQPKIVGSGPFLSEIEALKGELGLHDLVVAGNLSSAGAIYGDADILLLMSRVEGTPNVVIEAQCCGLAVAACDVGGVKEALMPGNLILPVDADPETAATLIEDWISGLDWSQQEANVLAVRNKYDVTKLADETLKLYRIDHAQVLV